jgi:hypothetical protein
MAADDRVLEMLLLAKDEASAVFDKVADKLSSFGKYAAGAAAALEVLGRSAEGEGAQIARVAYISGLSEDAIKKLTMASRDAGYSFDNDMQLFTKAAQEGLKSSDAIKQYADYWKNVGKASGESAIDLAKAADGLASMGIKAKNSSDSVNALGYLLKNTDITLSEFLTFVSRSAPELSTMKLSVDQVAAVMGILDDKGISGRKAIGMFDEAIKASGGSLSALLQQLNISTAEFEQQTAQVARSGNVIKDLSNIQKEHVTRLQELQGWLQKQRVEYSGLFEAASALVPALTAVSLAAMGISAAIPAISAVGAAISGLSASFLVTMALIAGGLLLFATNWEGAAAKCGIASDAMFGKFATKVENFKLNVKEFAVWAVALVSDYANRIYDTAVNFLFNPVGTMVGKLMSTISEALHYFGEEKLASAIDSMLAKTDAITGHTQKTARETVQIWDDATQQILYLEQERTEEEKRYTDTVKEQETQRANIEQQARITQAQADQQLADAEKRASEEALQQWLNDYDTMLSEYQQLDATGVYTYDDIASAAIDSFDEQAAASDAATDSIIGNYEEQRDAYQTLNSRASGATGTYTMQIPEGAATPYGAYLKYQQGKSLTPHEYSLLQQYSQWAWLSYGTGIGLQHGGIVTKPTAAIIGEKGAEAVIPLDKLSSTSGKPNIIINMENHFEGVMLSDRWKAREFVRELGRLMNEELSRAYA